jgi:hypothetical protein
MMLSQRRFATTSTRVAILGLVLALAALNWHVPAGAGAAAPAASKNFRLVTSLPMPGVAVSGTAVGNTYFASSWQSGLYAFDISDPKAPQQVGHLGPDKLLVQNSENEQMATNGKILLLSRINGGGTVNRLIVIDVRDPANMRILAELPGGGSHTMTCLYDCKWAYGSRFGHIVDLRVPSEPKLLEQKWTTAIGGISVHDVTEVRPGLVVTSSKPMYALDVTDPAKPVVLARTTPTTEHTGHNNFWPRGGKDRFLLTASEGTNNGTCDMHPEDGRTLQIWKTTDWQEQGFTRAGAYSLTNGDGSDGQPALSAGVQGCSAHWGQEHPTFRNGGLVAMASFGHGVRLLNIGRRGQPREVAYFLKDVHQAVDVEWITDRLVYVVEVGRGGGIDVIEYTGPLPEEPGPL